MMHPAGESASGALWLDFDRRLMLQSLTNLNDKLIKIGAKVVSHSRYIAFQMAEVAIARRMFQEILRLIAEPRPKNLRPRQREAANGHAFKDTGEVGPDAKQNHTLRRRQRQVGL